MVRSLLFGTVKLFNEFKLFLRGEKRMISIHGISRTLASTLAVCVLTIASAPEAKAGIAAPLWGCKLKASVQDSSVSMILGIVNIEGRGKLKCMTALGQKTSQDVAIRIFGVSVGPDIAVPTGQTANLDVVSATVGLSSLSSIYGEYHATAAAHANFGTLKASTAYDFLTFTPARPHGGLSQSLSLAIEQGGQVGLGVNVSVTGMSIEPVARQ